MNEKEWEVTLALTIVEIAPNGFDAIRLATLTLEEMEANKDIKARLVVTDVKPLPGSDREGKQP